MTGEYDHYFRLYASIFFDRQVAWPWFKSQAMVESSLIHDAVSPVGAKGLMQLMAGTVQDNSKKLQVIPHILAPRTNIMFGISYDRTMWDIFKREKGLERLKFTFAAYNAGAGNIIRAQKLVSRPDDWQTVAAALPEITGQHAAETTNYVKKILLLRQKIIEN